MNKIIEQITSKINNLPKSTLQALIGAVVAAVIVVFAVVFFMGGPSTPQERDCIIYDNLLTPHEEKKGDLHPFFNINLF